MDECFFWYRPTRVVPVIEPLISCVCVCVCLSYDQKLSCCIVGTQFTLSMMIDRCGLSACLCVRAVRAMNAKWPNRSPVFPRGQFHFQFV